MSSVVICPTCGHPNAVDSSFCEMDDTWLGGEHRRSSSMPAPDEDQPDPGGDELESSTPSGSDEAVGAVDPRSAPAEHLGAVDPRRARERPGPATTTPPAGHDDQFDPGTHPPGEGRSPAGVDARTDVAAPADRPDLSGPRCRSCGRLSPPGAATCSCGESLAPIDEPQRPRRPSGRRDRGDNDRGAGAFARAQRQANGGRRPRFDRPLSSRVVWFRAVTAALLALLVIAVLAGWHRTLADSVGDVVARVVPGMVEQIDVVSTQTDDGADEVGSSLNAVDGTDLAWETGWNAEAAVPDAECGTARGGASLLRVGFGEPTSVSRVTVLPGLAPDDRRRAQQFRPRRIDVVFDDGTCVVVDLPDDAAAVEVDLPTAVSSTAGATVAIIDSYPTPDGGDDLVAIREIGFGRR